MDTTTRWQRLKQKIYIVTPLFLLVLCLGFVNFAPGWVADHEPVPTISPSVVSDGRMPTTTAVFPSPIASPTTPPSPTPYPTLPPEATITLLGPPQDGRFRGDDTISFYWDWPVPLQEDQHLAVYGRLDGQEMLLGTVDEPNLGQSYRIQVKVQAMTVTAAETSPIQWFVRLQSTAQPQLFLLESKTRTLTIMP